MVNFSVAWELLLYFFEFRVLIYRLAIDVDFPTNLELNIKHATLLGECPNPQYSLLKCLINLDNVPVWVKHHVIHVSEEVGERGVS